MPGTDTFQVKCEPLSDEDENNSQFAKSFFSDQLTTDYIPIKLESTLRPEENASSNLLQHFQCVQGTLEELAPAPAGPAATPVCEPVPAPRDASLATLEPAHAHDAGSTLISRHMELMSANEVADSAEFVPLMAIKDEPTSEGEHQQLSSDDTSDSSGPPQEIVSRGSPKSWTQKDMDQALEALRKHHMSLTKASSLYGIPSTTLWQRAHRLGIDTPKKDGGAKSWGAADLARALAALRAGALSANKASKAYGIPSSTLYKIARREGIRLAAPFNAAPTAWRRADLARALGAIRCGASVQRAAHLFGIPTGIPSSTLYKIARREGIRLAAPFNAAPTAWRRADLARALGAIRCGASVQRAAHLFGIPTGIPSSTLYKIARREGIRLAAPFNAAPTAWRRADLARALGAIRCGASVQRAAHLFGIPTGIPSSTLYKIARREGIRLAAPFNAAPTAWRRADLARALGVIRCGASVQRAAHLFGIPTGIPSSTLYKIARREGIRLAAPFNAAPTAWRRADLARALGVIRCGASVQRAAHLFGIPTGTLYGRCKREGIELSRSNPTPWSEDAMEEALEAVRVGQMSINQAAIHYNLPYSSLYGRFKRCKSVQGHQTPREPPTQPETDSQHETYYPHPHIHTEHTYLDTHAHYEYYTQCTS